jgi:hypothetical protein
MKQLVIIKTLSVLAIAPLTACGGSFDIYSPSQIHRTVRSLESGHYVVYYKWRPVEETYGKDRAAAIPEYLKAMGIVPSECTRGVIVIRGGETEGGGGWAEFRCK